MILGGEEKHQQAPGGKGVYVMPGTTMLEYDAAKRERVAPPETRTAGLMAGKPPQGYLLVRQNYPERRHAVVEISEVVRDRTVSAP